MDIDYSYSTSGDPVAGAIGGVFGLIIAVILIVALWRVFAKAGRPGWHAIIPILNTYDLIKIAGYSGWFLLLFLIPGVNIIIAIVVSLGVAKNFGKSGLFGFFGLVVFSFIGYLILAFGSAQYIGEKPAA